MSFVYGTNILILSEKTERELKEFVSQSNPTCRRRDNLPPQGMALYLHYSLRICRHRVTRKHKTAVYRTTYWWCERKGNESRSENFRFPTYSINVSSTNSEYAGADEVSLPERTKSQPQIFRLGALKDSRPLTNLLRR